MNDTCDELNIKPCLVGLVLQVAPASARPGASPASVVHYKLKLATRAKLSCVSGPCPTPITQSTWSLRRIGPGQWSAIELPLLGSSASKVWEVS